MTMKITLEESTTDEVSKPLQIIIERLLSQYESSDSLQWDLIYVVIIVLMFENGFLPLDNDDVIEDPVRWVDLKQLRYWRSSDGIFETKFVLHGYIAKPLKLIFSPLGTMALVNVVLGDTENETYSVCLPVSRYVVSPKASTIPMIFRDLKHLAVTLKNNILAPIKSRILSFCGYPSASLTGLPDDLLFKILLYLSVTDVINVKKTCKQINCLLFSDILWHKLYIRDFGNVVNERNIDWIDFYKDTYLNKKQEMLRNQRRTGSGALHDLMDYSDFISYIDNSMWAAI